MDIAQNGNMEKAGRYLVVSADGVLLTMTRDNTTLKDAIQEALENAKHRDDVNPDTLWFIQIYKIEKTFGFVPQIEKLIE